MSALCSLRHCPELAVAGKARCTEHEARRVRDNERNRERRSKRQGALLKTATRCAWKVAGGHDCGGPITTTIGRFGETIVGCDWCERRERGICRDCSRPVEGTVHRALRCAEHKEVARQAQVRAYAERNPEKVRACARAHYAEQPERRQSRNDYKRAWRKANREKVRAQKQRYVERHKADPKSAYNRYHAKYRAKYRQQKRELERDRLKVAPPPRKTAPLCTRCGKSTRWRPIHKGYAGKPWTVCSKCLFPCERKLRERNRRRALARAKAWLESIPDPSRIRRPPSTAVRGPGWERLCITPGCDTVVTHRKKKCTKCRQRDEALAAQRLADRRGRGRRTDLEAVA